MDTVEEGTGEDTAKIARRRAKLASWRRVRRIKRFDIMVASAVLLLLVLGWAMDFVRSEFWPATQLLTANGWHHAWSGGALR